MLQAILEAIRCREEEVEFLGRTYRVREVAVADQLAIEDELEREIKAKDKGLQDQELGYWRLFVRAVVDKETGQAAFAAGDIPDLRAGSRAKLAPLMAAVDRVHGFSAEDNAKK